MKTGYARFLFFLLPISMIVSCSHQTSSSDDVQAIKTTVNSYSKAINARDPYAAVAMMTERAYYAKMNLPAITGKEAIRKILQGNFERIAQYDLEFSASPAEVQINGDLGAARGTWKEEASDKSGILAPVNGSGNWVVICRRQEDGSWKWESVHFNSDQLLPGTTADGADEQDLVRIEKEMAAAMNPEYKERGPNNYPGPVQKRAPLSGAMLSYKVSSLIIRGVKPRVFGDSAIVSLTGEMKGTYNGKPTSATLQGIDFFVRRDGHWHIAYSQNNTTIP